MLPPYYFDTAASDLVELYSQLDQTIIRDIVRRLVKTGGITETAKWQAERLQESGLLMDDIIQSVASMSNASVAQIKAMFEDAGIESVQYDSEIYKAAGLTPLPLKQSPSAVQILQANIRKTSGYIQNLTMTTASSGQQAFIQAVTMAEMQIESGAFNYIAAIRKAVSDTAQAGSTVVYPSGHHDYLDVAVRRAALTGISQTAANISLGYADDMDCDLVETTAHPGARPEHQIWQGKVFSRSGKKSKYPDFVSSTGYGTGDGLCGWNCRHSFFPYFEGISSDAYPRDKIQDYNSRTVTYNDEKINYYDATQLQRSFERQIRATKRKLAGYDEGIKSADDEQLRNAMQENFNNSSVKLKQQESSLKDFLHQTGLDRQNEREQALGFGRSQAQKAVQAKKKVDIQRQNDILKEEIRAAGNLSKAAEIHLTPLPVDTNSLSFDENHINLERGHNVTHEQAVQWLKDAKISATVWKGRYERYYGTDGTVYVDTVSSSIRTAFSHNQYDDTLKSMMEVVTKHGL